MDDERSWLIPTAYLPWSLPRWWPRSGGWQNGSTTRHVRRTTPRWSKSAMRFEPSSTPPPPRPNNSWSTAKPRTGSSGTRSPRYGQPWNGQPMEPPDDDELESVDALRAKLDDVLR